LITILISRGSIPMLFNETMFHVQSDPENG
jgi:hypothetical protein